MTTLTWDDLRRRFLHYAEATRTPAGADWREGWQLVVQDPWYQDQLARFTCKIVGHQRPQRDWLEEVRHEAMALLARQFERAPDLHLDPHRAERQFAAWMRTIIYRTCQEAFRRLLRLYGCSGELPKCGVVDPRNLAMETHAELNMAIDQLTEPQRSVLTLYAKGYSLREIAVQLELQYGATCRACRRGIAALRAMWRDSEPHEGAA